MPQLEITEVVIVDCNTVNNSYQNDSRVLYTFIPNKLFSKLLDISTKNFYFIPKLTDQNPKLLETQEKINNTLVIN